VPIYRAHRRFIGPLAIRMKQSKERSCTIGFKTWYMSVLFFLNITDSSQKYGNMYKMYDFDL